MIELAASEKRESRQDKQIRFPGTAGNAKSCISVTGVS